MGGFKPGQKKKYECKICNKSFVSGRSLGGHMRLHSSSSKNIEEELEAAAEFSKKHCEVDPQIGELYYKCKKCSKEFGSMKALFGHMKCHSSKKLMTRMIQPDHNDRDALPELTSFVCQTRRKRSRIKYNSIREEVEDVAECLILLSRGPSVIDRTAMFDPSSDDQINKTPRSDDNDGEETEHKQETLPLHNGLF